MENQYNKIYPNDEIDLFELFKTIWGYKVKIIIITIAFVLLGLAYTMMATPWYKATALVEIGYYKSNEKGTIEDVSLAQASNAIERLKVTYIDLVEEIPNKDVIVQSISPIKGNDKFFNIVAFGKTNDLVAAKISEMVQVLESKHQEILDGYLNKQKVALANVDRKIAFLKNNSIAALEDQIAYLKNTQLPRLDKQIVYMQDVVIPAAKRDVDLVDNVTVPSIEKRIKLNNDNMNKFEKELKNLRQTKHGSSATNAVLLQMIEQNLIGRIATLQEGLISLDQQKDALISETKPKLQDKVYQLNNVELVTLQTNKDAILSDKLPALKRELVNLQTEELGKLIDEKSILELSLKPYNYQNTQIVSNIMTSEKPNKPKKLIILAVSFVIGLMISISGVLVYDFYKKRAK